MTNHELRVNNERLAAQYLDQLLYLLNQVEEASDNYAYTLSECGVRVDLHEDLNQLRDAVSNYKANKRG